MSLVELEKEGDEHRQQLRMRWNMSEFGTGKVVCSVSQQRRGHNGGSVEKICLILRTRGSRYDSFLGHKSAANTANRGGPREARREGRHCRTSDKENESPSILFRMLTPTGGFKLWSLKANHHGFQPSSESTQALSANHRAPFLMTIISQAKTFQKQHTFCCCA